MAVIYLPNNNQNMFAPVANTMSNVITGLAMRKADANIRAKEVEAQRAYSEQQEQDRREFTLKRDETRSDAELIQKGFAPVQEGSIRHARLGSENSMEGPYGKVWRKPPETPLSWQKLAGTNLVAVRTSDGKTLVRADTQPDSTNVTVNTGGKPDPFAETYLKKSAGDVAKSNQGRLNAAQEAVSQNQQYQVIKDAIMEGAPTGWGEETIMKSKSALNTMWMSMGFEGFDTDKIGHQEMIMKVGNEMALRLRNPDSGLGLTGNTSNKDLEFLKGSVAGLNKTEAGNLQIIETAQRLNQFKIDLAEYQQKLVGPDGVPPRDIESKLLKFANNYQVFSPEQKQKMKSLSKLGGAIDRLGTKRTGMVNGRAVVELGNGRVFYQDTGELYNGKR